MIDPTKDEIRSVSDLYLPFGTDDHIEILSRCVNIFEILINYHKEIHENDLWPKFRQMLSEAKKLVEENKTTEQIDQIILLLTKQMREVRDINLFKDPIKIENPDQESSEEDEY